MKLIYKSINEENITRVCSETGSDSALASFGAYINSESVRSESTPCIMTLALPQ